MGVAVVLHILRARWQQFKNMSAALIGSIVSFLKICITTS